MRRIPLVRGLAIMLLLHGGAAALIAFPTASAAPPVKGSAALGKPVFVKNCVVCHKVDGSGGMKLTGNPTPNWKDPKTWADPKRTDAYLRDCITIGKVKSAWSPGGRAAS